MFPHAALMKRISRELHRHPELRHGQAVFNCMSDICSDIAERVAHKEGIDPFYDDNKVDEFIKRCEEIYP